MSMTIAEYIEETLDNGGYTKIWLAELLGITKQKLNYRFKTDCFSANELFIISTALDINLEKMKKEIESESVKMNVLTTIARNARRMEPIEKFKDGEGFTVVYGIDTENQRLKVWNSSNHKKFDHEYALSVIADSLEDEEKSGHFSDGNFNEIQWELTEI